VEGRAVSQVSPPILKGSMESPNEFHGLLWASSIIFSAYGLRIGIRMTDSQGLQSVLDILPYGWRPSLRQAVTRLYSVVSHGNDEQHRLYCDSDLLLTTSSLDDVRIALEWDLQMYVAEMALNRVFVHAGVVGWKGQAIILPGRSHTGKTTLVAELVRAGATYYSDEYAVLDQHGRVHPFARPLGVRDGSGISSTKLPVQALGGRTGTRPLPAGLVVVSTYEPGGTWEPVPISPGQGALALLNNTVPARRKPQAVLDALHQVVACARILEGVRGEASVTAPLILAMSRDYWLESGKQVHYSH
jgi:hypothetical protein